MSKFTCIDDYTCPCQGSVEYDLAVKIWFIIYCDRCERVYHSKANGRLLVYADGKTFKERKG